MTPEEQAKLDRVTISDKIINFIFLWAFPRRILPNHLTIFRFMTIPFVIFFLVNQNYFVAIPLFIISAMSDALDGAMARTRNQITDWGKMFDPVADKLLIGTTSAIVVSVFVSQLLAFFIIGFEVFIASLAIYKKKVMKFPIQAQIWGKIKMILQSVGISLLLIYAVWSLPIILLIASYLLYISIIFAIMSLFSSQSI